MAENALEGIQTGVIEMRSVQQPIDDIDDPTQVVEEENGSVKTGNNEFPVKTGNNESVEMRGVRAVKGLMNRTPNSVRKHVLSEITQASTSALCPIVADEKLEQHQIFPLPIKEVQKNWDPIFDQLRKKSKHADDSANVRDCIGEAYRKEKRALRNCMRSIARYPDEEGGALEDQSMENKNNMVSLEHLITWLKNKENDFEIPDRSGIDIPTLIKILEDFKNAHVEERDHITRAEFYRLIQKFHQESTAQFLAPHQKLIKMLAYADVLKWWPPPLLMLSISIIEFSMFVYHITYLSYYFKLPVDVDSPIPFCSVWIFNPKRRWEPWRYVTYGLVHGGIVHAVFNFTFQMLIGVSLELTNRWWRVACVYISGILAGSLMTHLLDPKVYLAGSSGGVYALIAAHLSSIILNWKEDEMMSYKRRDKYNEVRFLRTTQVRLARVCCVVIFAVLDTSISIYNRIGPDCSSGHDCPTTGYIAHLGGFLAGLLVGLLVLHNRRSQLWERVTKQTLLLLIIIGFFVLMVLNIGAADWWPGTFYREENSTWTDSERDCQKAIYCSQNPYTEECRSLVGR